MVTFGFRRNLFIYDSCRGFPATDFEPGSIQDRGLAVEVNDNVSESKGVYAQGSGNLNCQKEQDMNVEARTGSLEFDVKEDVYWRFDGFNYVESLRVLSDVTEEEMGAESTDMSFLSRQLVYNSQGALSNGQVGPSDSTTTGDNMDPLGEWLQLPCEPERWWRIPDLIHEVLPLPKNFNLQLKVQHNPSILHFFALFESVIRAYNRRPKRMSSLFLLSLSKV